MAFLCLSFTMFICLGRNRISFHGKEMIWSFVFRLDFYMSSTLLISVVFSNVSRFSTRMEFSCTWFLFFSLKLRYSLLTHFRIFNFFGFCGTFCHAGLLLNFCLSNTTWGPITYSLLLRDSLVSSGKKVCGKKLHILFRSF